MTRGEITSLQQLVSKMARGSRHSKQRYGSWEITDVHDTLLARVEDSDEADLLERLDNHALDELLELAEEAIYVDERLQAIGFVTLDDLVDAHLEEQRSAVDRLADLIE